MNLFHNMTVFFFIYNQFNLFAKLVYFFCLMHAVGVNNFVSKRSPT